MTVCSGGIIGLGETLEDRIDMALELRDLGIMSVPINVLNPIAGTPFGELPILPIEEVRRTIAIWRFILPGAAIRLAGGRGLMPDKGETMFKSGANATISGELLTTTGNDTADDMAMIEKLGYEVKLP
jgi:biotin synthase